MRTLSLSLLAACAAFLLAPTASAQRTAKAWYEVTAGDRTQMFQAEQVVIHKGNNRIQVEADRQEVDFRPGEVSIVFYGTGAEPTAQNGVGDDAGTRDAWSNVSISSDGKTVTITTEIRELNDGKPTGETSTTTTTITHNDDGSKTTTTTTTT